MAGTAGESLVSKAEFDSTTENMQATFNTALNSKIAASLVYTKTEIDDKLNGKADGSYLSTKADLVDGKVPAEQLPSYVDDVLEYDSESAFPTTGEAGKIYVATDTNLTYRWGGSQYVEISPSLALGETSSTAYRGDLGKSNADAITEHKKDQNNPHKVTANQIGALPAIHPIENLYSVEDGEVAFKKSTAFYDVIYPAEGIRTDYCAGGKLNFNDGKKVSSLTVDGSPVVTETMLDEGYGAEIGDHINDEVAHLTQEEHDAVSGVKVIDKTSSAGNPLFSQTYDDQSQRITAKTPAFVDLTVDGTVSASNLKTTGDFWCKKLTVDEATGSVNIGTGLTALSHGELYVDCITSQAAAVLIKTAINTSATPKRAEAEITANPRTVLSLGAWDETEGDASYITSGSGKTTFALADGTKPSVLTPDGSAVVTVNLLPNYVYTKEQTYNKYEISSVVSSAVDEKISQQEYIWTQKYYNKTQVDNKITALGDTYATKSDVADTYATKSALETLAAKVDAANALLEEAV